MSFKDFLKFSISHHHPHQYNRCYRLGKLHVCARCLGLYPILITLIILQFYVTVPQKYENIIIFILPLPAIIDWASNFIFDLKGFNWLRTLTGFLLGIGLSRLIWLHIKNPFNKISLKALFLYVLVVSFVISVKFMRNMLKHYDDY